MRDACSLSLATWSAHIHPMLARSPLKLILFGEHSVMSGGGCIAVAVNRYACLAMHASEGLSATDSNGCILDLNALGIPVTDMHISLDAPLGCGLGTSAAMSLLASYGLRRTVDGLLEDACRLENVFHGRSSGVDVSVCHTGGLISFRNRQIERLPTCFLDRFKIMFFNSGIPRSTAAAIRVAETRGELLRRIDSIAEEAHALLGREFALPALHSLIRRNQEILEDLGVCPEEMRQEVCRLRRLGIESKITGAGCGGCLVTVVERDCDLPGWTAVSIDSTGFQTCE